jgi:glycosyltransferase involved in cell wall biosynthesis
LNIAQIRPAFRSRKEHPSSWIRSLTKDLAKRSQVEFRVFTHSRMVRAVRNAYCDGVPFTFIPKYDPERLSAFSRYYAARIQFSRQLKCYAPDVVHGFGTESGYGFMAASGSIPSIVTIQGIVEKLSPFSLLRHAQLTILTALERKTIKSASCLVARTSFSEKWAKRVNPGADVYVIPNAVNPEFFSVRTSCASKCFLFIGNSSRIKAADIAIQALAHCRDQSILLSIIGDGPMQRECSRLASDLGVSDRVEFCGPLTRDQIIHRMSDARGLIITSRMDTSPNVVTEAHAAGLPVIGTRAGGIPDMIANEIDGYIVDVDDFISIAEKMDRLAASRERSTQLGAAGRDKVKWLNDPSRIADLHEQVYHYTARR